MGLRGSAKDEDTSDDSEEDFDKRYQFDKYDAEDSLINRSKVDDEGKTSALCVPLSCRLFRRVRIGKRQGQRIGQRRRHKRGYERPGDVLLKC